MSSRHTHQLPDDIKLPSAEEAQALVQTIRDGGPGAAAAREELIVRLGPLVFSIVAKHVREFPRLAYYTDDLTSHAQLSLVQIVDALGKNDCDHAFSYIVNGLRWCLKNVYDDGFALTAANRGKLRKRGGRVPRSHDINLPKNSDEYTSYGDDTVPTDLGMAYTSDPASDMLEEVFACCRDQRDRDIAALRLKDWSPKEIAAKLGYGKDGHSNVSKRLREIYAKLEERRRD